MKGRYFHDVENPQVSVRLDTRSLRSWLRHPWLTLQWKIVDKQWRAEQAQQRDTS